MNASNTQKPDARELRSFGLSTGTVVGVLFGALIPWIWDLGYPAWPWVVMAVLGIWALIAPSSLHPVYHHWMRIGLAISKVTTPIILGIVFFVVIAPVGMLFRIFSRDPLNRQFDANASSYRIESDNQSTGTLEKPY